MLVNMLIQFVFSFKSFFMFVLVTCAEELMIVHIFSFLDVEM